jgi:NSS family neurotransmitter:Na+ symporter
MAAWCFRWAVLIFEGDLAAASAIDVSKIYLEHIKDGPGQFLGSLALVVITGSLSALGVRLGMGFLAWVVLPAVAITLLGVLDFIFLYTDLRSVSEFLFARDLSAWRLDAIWVALSSAGITLGAGLGVGMALGAQSPPGLPWGRSILAVAVLDTAFMMVTAVIVCAALFEVNVAPAEGLATVFIGLAYAFANLPLGETYGALFYFSMACIAAGATVILVEPTVLVIGRDWGAGRLGGSILAHTLIALVVAFCLFFDAAILANLATLTVNWLIPASLLAMSLFVGWLMPRPVLRGELYREPLWLFWLWWCVLRWLVPPVCAAWLIRGLL